MTEEDEAFEDLAKRQGYWGMQGSRKHQILRFAENVESKETNMTLEALKKMYQLLLTEPHSPTVCAQLERIAREALAEHAMRETQRLGQEIEQEPVACKTLCELCVKRGYFFCANAVKTTPITAPTQRTEQNFCPRCGKRTKDIHTCTPPRENT